GQKVDIPCYTSDYFPTIARILNIDITQYNRPYDGLPLLEIIENKALKRYLPFRIKNQAALIGKRYKIYSNDDGQTFEMYDLEVDPHEKVYIAKERPKVIQQLVVRWNTWKMSQENSASGKDYKTN